MEFAPVALSRSILLYINGITKLLIPNVIEDSKNCIIAHFQSVLNNAGINPKKNVVQLNPTGAVFISPVMLFVNITSLNFGYVSYLRDKYDIKTTTP